MVMSIWKRLAWFVVGIFLILYVVRCQVTETVWNQANLEIAAKQQNYTAEITENELNSFIKLYPQYKELGFDNGFTISYQTTNPSKWLDWKSKIWFVYHQWDADRFFYVQQRISALLFTLNIRRNAKALIKQLKTRPESSAVRQMLELQRQRSKAGEGNKTELQLVAAREEVLKKLFE